MSTLGRTPQISAGQIRDTARRHLGKMPAANLSLRAIARELGVTAPALYRYYPSRDDLLTALIVDAYTGLAEALEAARDAAPADDVVAQLWAASRAYRRWALDHPHEFSLVFGGPIPGYAAPEAGPVQAAGQRFGTVFLELHVRMWQHGRFRLPPPETIGPNLHRQLTAYATEAALPLPAEALQIFVAGWSRLHGLISLEVFGHFGWLLDDAEELFVAELAALCDRLGVQPPAGALPSPSPTTVGDGRVEAARRPE